MSAHNLKQSWWYITSEIWPQSYIITFQQPIHRLFDQRHVAGVIDTDTMEGEKREKGGAHACINGITYFPCHLQHLHTSQNEWRIVFTSPLTFECAPPLLLRGRNRRKVSSCFFLGTLRHLKWYSSFFFLQDKRGLTYSCQCSNSKTERMRIPHNIKKEHCWWQIQTRRKFKGDSWLRQTREHTGGVSPDFGVFVKMWQCGEGHHSKANGCKESGKNVGGVVSFSSGSLKICRRTGQAVVEQRS